MTHYPLIIHYRKKQSLTIINGPLIMGAHHCTGTHWTKIGSTRSNTYICPFWGSGGHFWPVFFFGGGRGSEGHLGGPRAILACLGGLRVTFGLLLPALGSKGNFRPMVEGHFVGSFLARLGGTRAILSLEIIIIIEIIISFFVGLGTWVCPLDTLQVIVMSTSMSLCPLS